MPYKTELGIFGNFDKLYDESYRTKQIIAVNKENTEIDLMELYASDIEAVEDEFNAITEE